MFYKLWYEAYIGEVCQFSGDYDGEDFPNDEVAIAKFTKTVEECRRRWADFDRINFRVYQDNRIVAYL